MAHLARETVLSGHNFAVHNDAAAHTGAECQKHRIGRALTAAAPSLTERRDIRIVSDLDADTAEQLRELARRVHFPPVQIDAHLNIASRLHGTRHTDSHADQFCLALKGLFHRLPNALGDVRQHMRALLTRVRRELPLFQNGSVRLKQAELDTGPADVYTDANFLHGSFPPFGLLQPDFFDMRRAEPEIAVLSREPGRTHQRKIHGAAELLRAVLQKDGQRIAADQKNRAPVHKG